MLDNSDQAAPQGYVCKAQATAFVAQCNSGWGCECISWCLVVSTLEYGAIASNPQVAMLVAWPTLGDNHWCHAKYAILADAQLRGHRKCTVICNHPNSLQSTCTYVYGSCWVHRVPVLINELYFQSMGKTLHQGSIGISPSSSLVFQPGRPCKAQGLTGHTGMQA